MPDDTGRVGVEKTRSPHRAFLVRVAVLLVVVLGAWLWWYAHEPQYYVRLQGLAGSRNRDGQQQEAVARLVQLGPRAVDPMLDDLAALGPWSPYTQELPGALSKIGPEAHRRIVERIDHETQMGSRVRLIFSLQAGFGDFSRLPVVLGLMERDAPLGRGLAHRLAPQLADQLGPLPWPVARGSGAPEGFAPAFVVWYAEHTQPRGPLPAYTFRRISRPKAARSLGR